MKKNHFLLLTLFFMGFLLGCEKDPQNNDDTEPVIGEYTAKHVKNVLIEDFTGTWCGYCPRLAYAIDDATSTSDKVIAVAVHDDEDMGYTYVSEMVTKFGITGYPTGLIDRAYDWPYPENFSGLNYALNLKAPLGIKIESSVQNNIASIAVTVEFAVDIPFSTSIIVCLTEDGVIANQRNYYDDGKGDPIINFVHKHVLRKAATNIFGDAIPADQAQKDNTATFNYTMNVASYNQSNCHIVAFVTKTSNLLVYNVQSAKLGETNDFQYLEGK